MSTPAQPAPVTPPPEWAGNAFEELWHYIKRYGTGWHGTEKPIWSAIIARRAQPRRHAGKGKAK